MARREASLNFRRQLLQKVWRHQGRYQGQPREEFIRGALQCDPASLQRAAKFFELDHTYPADLFVLALVLAEELFGERKRGRKPGNRAWDWTRFLELGFLYEKLKSEWPRLNDTRIAAVIVKDPAFKEYRSNPELIRQRLPEAKRELAGWEERYGTGDDDRASDYDDLLS